MSEHNKKQRHEYFASVFNFPKAVMTVRDINAIPNIVANIGFKVDGKNNDITADSKNSIQEVKSGLLENTSTNLPPFKCYVLR